MNIEQMDATHMDIGPALLGGLTGVDMKWTITKIQQLKRHRI